ncbi:MAG: hypothetical protein K9W44_01495 [Candidatus Lokiarchaeota archaeon]|nr:hypothetical protein [Candidatus Harpocratesius repetitus]
MANDAEKELKKLIKAKTNKKSDQICIVVKIRDAVDIVDLQIKEEAEGIFKVRVHSTNEKYPKWYTYGYFIDVKNLRLNYSDIKNRKQIQDILSNPNFVVHKPTKQLLDRFEKDFGGVIPDGMGKLFWRTERFKKKKDPFKVKMKAM